MTESEAARPLDWVFSGAAVFLLSGAVILLARQGAPDFDINAVTRNDTTIRLMFLLMYLVMAAIVADRFRAFFILLIIDPTLLALYAFMLLSVSWSHDPRLTVQRAVAVILTSLFGVYLATVFKPRQVLRLFVIVFGITMILSALVLVAIPAYGDSTLGWRGVYLFKNDLGRAACFISLLVLVELRLGVTRRVEAWILRALLALSLTLLVGSEARSALVVFAAVGALLIMLPNRKSRVGLRTGLFLLILAGLLIASMAGVRLVQVFALLGKDPSLTGRTPLWGYVITSISEHPLIGWGFAGFWGGRSAPSVAIWEHVAWLPTHAHNGFLDLWLDLGVVGVILLTVSLANSLIRSFRSRTTGFELLGSVGIVGILFLFLSATTESVFLKSNVFYTCLPAYIAAAIGSVRIRQTSQGNHVRSFDAVRQSDSKLEQ